MRWQYKPKQQERERIISKFLIIPRCMDNEWRWLERAKIKQEVVYKYNFFDELSPYWSNQSWVD